MCMKTLPSLVTWGFTARLMPTGLQVTVLFPSASVDGIGSSCPTLIVASSFCTTRTRGVERIFDLPICSIAVRRRSRERVLAMWPKEIPIPLVAPAGREVDHVAAVASACGRSLARSPADGAGDPHGVREGSKGRALPWAGSAEKFRFHWTPRSFCGEAAHLDDPRLDHHGRGRGVEGLDGPGDLIDVLLEVPDDDGARPLVHREQPVLVDPVGSEFAHDLLYVGDVGVGDLETPGHEGLQLLLGLEVLHFLLRRPAHGLVLFLDLAEGGDADDGVGLEYLGQRRHVGLQDDVQRLVPGDVGEADGDLPLDLGSRDEVQSRDIGDQAEDVIDVGVYEVQGEPLAGVDPGPVSGRLPARRRRRLDDGAAASGTGAGAAAAVPPEPGGGA